MGLRIMKWVAVVVGRGVAKNRTALVALDEEDRGGDGG